MNGWHKSDVATLSVDEKHKPSEMSEMCAFLHCITSPHRQCYRRHSKFENYLKCRQTLSKVGENCGKAPKAPVTNFTRQKLSFARVANKRTSR